MDEKISRMKELAATLTAAAKTYYQESREIMSNYEYDKLYDELVELEKETGVVLSKSPTQNVGYEVLSELPKERHESPMLSLDKTKSTADLQEWLGDQTGILSWKLDGLTVVLTYSGGTLKKAVTRGNGEIGEVITSNARVFANVPVTISFQGELVLRGEAVIRYSEFNRINEAIDDVDAKYKNPRNLCSGSVRQLNSQITAERNVNFEAFALVTAEGVDFKNSRKEQFEWLKRQGFDVVEYKTVTAETLPEAVEEFAEAVSGYDIPSDGLVLLLDDIAYGESLGRTAKFPRNAIAFKWADEIKETKLEYIEWSPSRTGLINPVAVFEPVELEGTTSSDYFGLTATLGYQNRNLFRGVELFDVSVRGGYEFTRVKTKRNSFELGVTTSFSFPRLITPLRVNRYNRAVDPRTKVEVSYSVQRRPYYHRALASAVWGYSWGKGRNSSFVLRPASAS